eukprot:1142657-Pelagomonas_calceolata.AAC.4
MSLEKRCLQCKIQFQELLVTSGNKGVLAETRLQEKVCKQQPFLEGNEHCSTLHLCKLKDSKRTTFTMGSLLYSSPSVKAEGFDFKLCLHSGSTLTLVCAHQSNRGSAYLPKLAVKTTTCVQGSAQRVFQNGQKSGVSTVRARMCVCVCVCALTNALGPVGALLFPPFWPLLWDADPSHPSFPLMHAHIEEALTVLNKHRPTRPASTAPDKHRHVGGRPWPGTPLPNYPYRGTAAHQSAKGTTLTLPWQAHLQYMQVHAAAEFSLSVFSC